MTVGLNECVLYSMTKQVPKKMHRLTYVRAEIWLAWVVGAVEALLLARLLLRLLAARPDSPSVALLYALTAPLTTPFGFLDQGQPRFGAALEFSTLVVAILVPVIAYLVAVVRRP